MKRDDFEGFLKALPSRWFAKGFVRLSSEAGTHFFNKVGEYVQIAPLEGDGQPPAIIVCIGRRIDPIVLAELATRLS